MSRYQHAFILLATCAPLMFISISAEASIEIFREDFNGYTGTFSGPSNDLGGHRTKFGIPTQAAGADSDLWLAARFEYGGGSIIDDVGVLEFASGGAYRNPAGRVDDDAGLVIKLDLTDYTDIELAFDWRTYNTESNDRFVVAYYREGDSLGEPHNAYDWFSDPSFGNGDMSASDPQGQANPWYVTNWTEVHRDTSPTSFQQESGIDIVGGAVTYIAFWLDNGNHDLAKFDNVVVTGVENPPGGGGVVPEPTTFLVWSLLGLTVGSVVRKPQSMA